MGRKGIVTSIFSRLVETAPRASSSSSPGGQVSPPWPWPSCGNNPPTTSFRAGDDDKEPCCTTGATSLTGRGAGATAGRLQLRGAAAGEMYKTVNSVYFDPAADEHELSSLDGGGGEDDDDKEVPDADDESCFSTTTASEEWSEAVIRSLGRSTSTHRFFFDPEPPSKSILPAAAPAASPQLRTTTTSPKPAEPLPLKPAAQAPDPEPDLEGEDGKTQQRPCTSKPSSSLLEEGCVAVALDSADPFDDFRASMEEMVAAHGLRDWAALEELLSWYLRINSKHNHPIIVGAFVDLLVGLASSPSTTATTTTTATTSGCTGTSTKSSSTSTTATTASTTATAAKAGGVANEASCSSSSSSCATPDDSGLLEVAGEKGK